MTTVAYTRNGKVIFQDQIQEESTAPVSALPPIGDLLAAQGRLAWRWLHAEAAAGRLTVARLELEFKPMIPRYGCRCVDHWTQLLVRIPFREDDQAAVASEWHNEVNRLLGKPLWPYSPTDLPPTG